MGCWGAKIFQNDEACDIKDTYTELIIVGYSDDEAEQKIISEFSKSGEGEFWLPLALTQWKLGRLSERVKGEALKEIARESACLHETWKESFIPIRSKELAEAGKKLYSEMPAKKKVKMPFWAWKCPWPIGSVIQFEILLSKEICPLFGNYVLLQIAGISKTKPEKIPCEAISVMLYDWYGHIAPAEHPNEISAQHLRLVDFVTRAGLHRKSYSILPSKEMIKKHSIKCFSKIPIGKASIEELAVGSPLNSTFEETICRTLLSL